MAALVDNLITRASQPTIDLVGYCMWQGKCLVIIIVYLHNPFQLQRLGGYVVKLIPVNLLCPGNTYHFLISYLGIPLLGTHQFSTVTLDKRSIYNHIMLLHFQLHKCMLITQGMKHRNPCWYPPPPQNLYLLSPTVLKYMWYPPTWRTSNWSLSLHKILYVNLYLACWTAANCSWGLLLCACWRYTHTHTIQHTTKEIKTSNGIQMTTLSCTRVHTYTPPPLIHPTICREKYKLGRGGGSTCALVCTYSFGTYCLKFHALEHHATYVVHNILRKLCQRERVGGRGVWTIFHHTLETV